MAGCDGPEHEARLRSLRLRRTALGLVFLSLPLALLAYYRGPWGAPQRTGLLLTWVAFYSLGMLVLAWSRCPRCLAFFFLAKPGFRLNPLRTRCGNCGLGLSGAS